VVLLDPPSVFPLFRSSILSSVLTRQREIEGEKEGVGDAKGRHMRTGRGEREREREREPGSVFPPAYSFSVCIASTATRCFLFPPLPAASSLPFLLFICRNHVSVFLVLPACLPSCTFPTSGRATVSRFFRIFFLYSFLLCSERENTTPVAEGNRKRAEKRKEIKFSFHLVRV